MTPKFHYVLLALGLLLGVSKLLAADSKSTPPAILSAYVKVSEALAADDLAAAKTAASAVAEQAGLANKKELVSKAEAVAKASKIDAARSAFRALSAAVEPLAVGQKDFVVMHCPMANADWVQATGDTKNPYYGKAMLECGSPK